MFSLLVHVGRNDGLTCIGWIHAISSVLAVAGLNLIFSERYPFIGLFLNMIINALIAMFAYINSVDKYNRKTSVPFTHTSFDSNKVTIIPIVRKGK